MNLKKAQKKYALILFALFLIPNAFVILLGIESFPFTCAPMFGHYINEDTNLYEFKFEGVKNSKTIDLIDYLGKPEDHFMRHFFSKVYGSTRARSPFSNKLSENKSAFQSRMDLFFQHYESEVLFKKYNMSLDQINLKVLRVNQKREPISKPEVIGYYNCVSKKYISIYINNATLSQTLKVSKHETY